MMQLPNLPGLELHPVSYGTAMNPYNNYYPRPTTIGPNTEYHGIQPPWPSSSFSNQRANIGTPALGAPAWKPEYGAFAVNLAFTYLVEAGKIYALGKILGITIPQKYIWLGALALTGLEAMAQNVPAWFTWNIYPGYKRT